MLFKSEISVTFQFKYPWLHLFVTTDNNTLCIPGFILKFPIWGDPADDNCFDDEAYWEVRALSFHQMVVLYPCCKLDSSVGFRCPKMRKPSPLCWNTTTTWSTSTRTCKLTFDPLFRSLPPLTCVTDGISLFTLQSWDQLLSGTKLERRPSCQTSYLWRISHQKQTWSGIRVALLVGSLIRLQTFLHDIVSSSDPLGCTFPERLSWFLQ